MQGDPKSYRIKSWGISITAHVVLMVVFWLASFTIPVQGEDSEVAGILINYGFDEEGVGEDAFNKEAPSTAEKEMLTPVFEKSNPTTNSSSEVKADKDYATQSIEEAPVVTTGKPSTKTNTETKSDPTPTTNNTVNEAAIYKGKQNNATGGGDGNGGKPGNQGSVDGDVGSGTYGAGMGTGTGANLGNSNGIALNLAGRKFLIKPNIKDDGQTQGKIVVEIKVDQNGTIIEASAGARGTTISNSGLWRKCEAAVMGAKLNSLSSAPDLQIGTVVFNFDLQ